jgi:hypothetical protein
MEKTKIMAYTHGEWAMKNGEWHLFEKDAKFILETDYIAKHDEMQTKIDALKEMLQASIGTHFRVKQATQELIDALEMRLSK